MRAQARMPSSGCFPSPGECRQGSNMQLARTKSALLLAVLTAVFMMAANLWALEKGKDGYYHTGTGVRVRTIAFVDVDVYEISHFMKELPPAKSKGAVVDMDVDKKISFKMLRDVDADKIKEALKEAYAMNGYGDGANIGKALGTFTSELKEGALTNIVYDAAKKTTPFTAAGGGSATIEGVDFMKATWRIWFGKINQPKLGDARLSRIP
jgi:hypothetical protein